MKITFLLPHIRISGGVKALLEYANRLARMGHDICLLIPNSQPRWYRPDKKLKLTLEGIKTLDPRFVDWMDNFIPIHCVPDFRAGCVPDADILVASSWQTAHAAADFPPTKGEKFYFVQHHETLWTRERDRAKAASTYRLPFRKIVISTWLKDIMFATYGQDACVLVTPVDRIRFFCEEKKWNRPPKICLLHHDYDWKGYADGIMAVKTALSKGNAARLVVFGEKLEDPSPLYQQAGFEFEYHYRPTGERLRKLYCDCDIYLCPSWHEGLGMPAMEAMACRSALVTADTGGCRDYAIHRETALVAKPRDIEGLAALLGELLADPDRIRTLSENGYRKMLEFDWDKNTQQLAALFKQSRTGVK